MPALGANSTGDWQNNDGVPDRFQAVAAGQDGAGPHSATEEHEAGKARRLAQRIEAAESRPRPQEEAMTQQFGEVNAQGQPLEGGVAAQPAPSMLPDQEDVLEAMKDVIDPELGINIVDLGLVYGVEISPNGMIGVEMTLTSAACPLTDILEQQVHQVLASMATEVQINWVWMPPWGPDKITEDGRDQLRALGFNV